MSFEAKLMSGIILITIPSIEYGGYFLLRVLSGWYRGVAFNGFQKAMFRAGHAHAGVLVLLSLICQGLADHAALSAGVCWFARAGVPAAALLIPAGFFFSALPKDSVKPNSLVVLIYAGALVLAAALITLGVGLLR